VVDLSAVTFIDSSVIAVLLRAQRRQEQGGHWLRVEGAHGPVSRVLEITGTDAVLRTVS
jgi:anti-sigma B factor antagonist